MNANHAQRLKINNNIFIAKRLCILSIAYMNNKSIEEKPAAPKLGKFEPSPLPWRFDKPNKIIGPIDTSTSREITARCSTVHIADVYETQFDLSEPETLDANAKLIVASVNHARDLAKALKACLDVMERVHGVTLPVHLGTFCEEHDWSFAVRNAREQTAAYEVAK